MIVWAERGVNGEFVDECEKWSRKRKKKNLKKSDLI
jgi:hypothetical protein